MGPESFDEGPASADGDPTARNLVSETVGRCMKALPGAFRNRRH
jgi:hypothetical protein